MAVQTYDKLNLFDRRTKVSVLPIKQFFAEMGMEDVDYDSRVELATKMSKDYDTILKMMILSLALGETIVRMDMIESLNTRLVETLREHLSQNPRYAISDSQIDVLLNYSDKYLLEQIQAESEYFVDVALRHLNDEYYFSEDRAIISAENEVNSVANYSEYALALLEGKTMKTWRTMEDYRVRDTHKALANVTIPIYELFNSGGSLLKFPKDETFGADREELVGCRCWVTYS